MPEVDAEIGDAARAARFGSASRLFWLKSVVPAGLGAGLLLSSQLWIGPRSFPFAPAFEAAGAIPRSFEVAAFVVLLGALAATMISRRPAKPIFLALAISAVLATRDQTRWQPWFYQYCFMLAALGSLSPDANEKKREAVLNTCRLIVASMYFYSGVQKLNPVFVNGILPWMVEPLAKLLPEPLHVIPVAFGYIVPFLEMGIGVGLLTNRCRQAAIGLALLVCAFVLVTIGPLGYDWNSVVWPWNVAMALIVITLFARTDAVSFRDVLWTRNSAFQKVVLFLFVIMPAFSFVHLWDSYLSSALYSGNTSRAQMYVSDTLIEKLPGEIKRYVTTHKSSRSTLNLSKWSYDELNVPPYPEPRVYREIARAICGYADDDRDVIMVVGRTPTLFSRRREAIYDCSGLTGRPGAVQ